MISAAFYPLSTRNWPVQGPAPQAQPSPADLNLVRSEPLSTLNPPRPAAHFSSQAPRGFPSVARGNRQRTSNRTARKSTLWSSARPAQSTESRLLQKWQDLKFRQIGRSLFGFVLNVCMHPFYRKKTQKLKLEILCKNGERKSGEREGRVAPIPTTLPTSLWQQQVTEGSSLGAGSSGVGSRLASLGQGKGGCCGGLGVSSRPGLRGQPHERSLLERRQQVPQKGVHQLLGRWIALRVRVALLHFPLQKHNCLPPHLFPLSLSPSPLPLLPVSCVPQY